MIDTTTPGSVALEPLPQHLAALNHANTVRLVQADVKRRFKDGRLHLDAVLVGAADLTDDERDAIDRMFVMDFVRAAHRVGRRRALLILAVPAISERKKIGTMTIRQRHVLAAELRSRVPGACAQRAL
jgi:hypothetical protein